ncbi:DsbA family oxidoreductase [Aquibium sp. A9E412]|uniref:DsbA family oxidoreductase n=1 Tax=Aquibium sp. A9E412 TaxID=2976767 RepID=UPI0025B02A35|nr:DsbA family oxidoreductase [Aquibium sp. A9E412]MDN2566347.1 DsbA family oxidoreductase [Aquibium sp. A9E412]
MSEPVTVNVDVVSDVMCPWCYIGQKRLDRALAALPQDVAVEVRWRPFQLDPTLPPEGKDRAAYLAEKFGDGERAGRIYETVREAGRKEAIAFDFDAIAVAPNTLDAHRVLRWAASAGPGVQDRLARRLFALYFEEGAHIGDHTVLVAAAREAGMDAALVETLLATEADRDAVRQEIATAAGMGINGVPCFLIDGRYAVMGAQEAEVLADAIGKVAAARRDGHPSAAG